ncbi:MAG: CapA family protein, partial [Faecousia sp.]
MKTFWRSLLTALKITLVIVLVVSLAGIGILGWYFYDTAFSDAPSDNAMFRFIESLVPARETQPTEPLIPILPTTEATEPPTTEPPTTLPPEPEHVVATATIGTVGDLLMHQPVFASCQQSDGSYNFESIFRYIKDTITSLDYAVANLETTFGGDAYTYQGNPAFNCPDALADYVADAGFDMLLTANNHAGDTMGPGIKRTVERVRESGLVALGSQLNGEEPKFQIVNVNGIKIGMVCYTWAYSGDGTKFSLNGLAAVPDEGQMNYFVNSNPDKLYREAEQIMAQMKAQGAEATMMFIHWGVEYVTTENAL